MAKGIDIADVERMIRASVNSPDWIRNVQLELDQTTDPDRRRILEAQLRRRREALAQYGEN